MKHKYYPPKYEADEFHCIHCNVFAHQVWRPMFIEAAIKAEQPDFRASRCTHCHDWTFWYSGKMIVPAKAPVEPPHPDMPSDCLGEYIEAREIFARSPRAAAALLRLCLQKLMPYLGETGKNINGDIKSLVSKGLPTMVQQALDYCRVVGNNAVHPGEIVLNDTPEVAQKLFEMINFIVDDRITRPNEIKALYDSLPEEERKNIEKRNGPGT